jgi:hypothetical protein
VSNPALFNFYLDIFYSFYIITKYPLGWLGGLPASRLSSFCYYLTASFLLLLAGSPLLRRENKGLPHILLCFSGLIRQNCRDLYNIVSPGRPMAHVF